MRLTVAMKNITQAFVLGAGLGTRLRPLTDDLPKPLVPIFQKRLITFAFDHLIDIGTRKFFVNTHHRPERFAEIFPESTYREERIEFRHEPSLLETAGGIANIADSLGHEPLLVYNGDILTDLPISRLIYTHFRAGNVVTLALRSNAGPKHIAFEPRSGRITDIRDQLASGAPEEFVFTGIYIVEPKFLDLLERGVKRSVIPVFLELIRRNEKLGGVVIDEGHWWDVGNREAYLQLHRELPKLSFPTYAGDNPEWKTSIHRTAIVDPTAQLRGCSVVGADCRVGADAILEDTILWPGAQIASRSQLYGCIVRSREKAEGVHRNSDI
ncbi:MAG: sugar phosphate nucleotidyltransferase [Verrucomicrobiota bacterium]|nr:sugar phosphate nucleotidyltransferase [Verrucomicrobiota bacterium]